MAPTTTFVRASRPLFNSTFAASQTRQALTRATPFRTAYRRQQWGRRWQSTSTTAEGAQAQHSWLKRMWDSPIGFKTVHFWAPVMKWALVIAGISDFFRPAEKLSLTQNGALTATGFIWTRWCLIIKPKNYLLAAANFFLGLVGIIQCSRTLLYNSSVKNQSVVEEVKEEVKEVVKSA